MIIATAFATPEHFFLFLFHTAISPFFFAVDARARRRHFEALSAAFDVFRLRRRFIFLALAASYLLPPIFSLAAALFLAALISSYFSPCKDSARCAPRYARAPTRQRQRDGCCRQMSMRGCAARFPSFSPIADAAITAISFDFSFFFSCFMPCHGVYTQKDDATLPCRASAIVCHFSVLSFHVFRHFSRCHLPALV